MRKTIRDYLRVEIGAVLERCQGMTLAEKRKALREAWQYGPRQYHPYKIWLDEARVQLGLKRAYVPGQVKRVPARGQQSLFGD